MPLRSFRPHNRHVWARLFSFTSYSWFLLALAIGLVATGIIQRSAAIAVWHRVWPVLAFLLLVKMASDLLDDCGAFAMLAGLIARCANGRIWLLFALFFLVTALCTALLSLDATVVLMVPIAVALSRRLHINSLPFLFATIWCANIGSLFLPISNLTNLLAQQHVQWSPQEFTRALLPIQLVLLAVLLVVLLAFFRSSLRGRFEPLDSRPLTRADARPIALLVSCGLSVGCFALAVMLGVAPWLACAVLDVVLLGILATLAPQGARVNVEGNLFVLNRIDFPYIMKRLPWTMAAFALGLFLIITPLSAQLASLLAPLFHSDGAKAPLLMGALGTVLANATNNLPAYLALEPSAHTPALLVMLLVGVNAGPIVTPWGSLANLLWFTMAQNRGITIRIPEFVQRGIILAPLVLLASAGVTAFI